MYGLYRPTVVAALGLMALARAHAQADPAAPVDTAASAPTPAVPVPMPRPPPPTESKFEGAVGLVMAFKPSYSGGSDRRLQPQVAGFVRYGRLTLTGAGGFTTRRQDDVERGLDAELLRRDRLRVNLALRYDPGRQESESDSLEGMGDVRPTLRTRLSVRWQPAPRWSLSLAGSADALGRGGGYFVDVGVSRTFPIDARQRWGLGLSITAAGDRYLQTWYGVTPEQSAASGYPVYRPRAGLRDVSASASWRMEIDPRWAGFAALGANRLLGPAADSPLTQRPGGFSISAGLARRF